MKKLTGFTLVEALLSIVIIGLIVSAGLPSLSSLIDDNRLEVVGPIFERSILLARSEARKGQENIIITPLASGGDWSQGWKVERKNSQDDISLIRHFDALPGSPSFTSDVFNNSTPITISPSTHAELPGEFHLTLKDCPDNVKYIYKLLKSGMISKRETTCT